MLFIYRIFYINNIEFNMTFIIRWRESTNREWAGERGWEGEGEGERERGRENSAVNYSTTNFFFCIF